MPSASKGRYQSRLFNFFHKQSRRFGEGFGRSLRQLQVATSWSLEALSKSIYLLLQKAVDSAGTQLSAAKEESRLKLQPSEPTADTAIVRILENIETQYIPSLDNSQLSISISTTSKTNIVPLTSCSLANQESGVVEIIEQDVCASPTLCEGTTIIPFSVEDCRSRSVSLQGENKNRRDAENTEERGKERLVILEGDRSNQISEEDAISNLKYSSGKIRGIASQLSNQNLVLVTSENEIIDILTLSQQQTLQNKIISEIANYWRSWRLSQAKQETKLLSRVESIFKIFAPSNDRKTETLLPISINARVKINPKTLASLDTAVAKLETNALVPVSRAQMIVQQRGGELIKVVKAKLDIFLYGDRNLTVSSKQVVADGNLESQKSAVLRRFSAGSKLTGIPQSKIQALISAALNYFYGKSQNEKIKQTPPTPYLSVSKPKTPPQLQSQQSTDDWVSFNDLFNSGLSQRNQKNQPLNKNVETIKKQLKPSTEVNNSSEKLFGRFQIPNWRTLRLKQKAGLQKPQKPVVRNQQDSYIKKSGQDAHTTGIYEKITITPNSRLKNQNQGEITQTHESTQVEAKPEWIETKAELIGYHKHPLEQLLALIDSAMLKIEEAFVNLAKALQKLWGK
ncbi:hypothetical protein IQ247_26215 [Plectonema cf. radiosum LEGE 06105]|uniref:Uncharacterized protein n=1 Tax=Plectonema cf. radiosum LEGE 06105 TaxID=945769 RepID=A0A8J7JWY0_9CYAN|nr:hypothetical protein [Plectonema radiosum]MBE9216115.1 hypothetical protein [Plectonema cf. radiosum LEGE 06105]